MAKAKMVEAEISIPGLSEDNSGAPASGFVLVVEGHEATGKSFLATTAPGHIAYYSIDAGADRVVDEARAAGKRIHLGSYEYKTPKFVTSKPREWWEAEGEKVERDVWTPFVLAWQGAIEEPRIRTMVMDTGTEFWELCRLASFGKLQQNPQLAYGPVNAEYLGMLKAAKLAGKIVIVLHQVGQKYERYTDEYGKEKSKEVPGVFERKGMNKIHYVADAIVRMHYTDRVVKRLAGKNVETPAAWETEIIRAKSNMGANGQRFETVDFATLMSIYLKPNADADLWSE